MYDIGEYYQAKNPKDAVRALCERPEAVLIAGGTDVLIRIRNGRLAGRALVSIHGMKELEGVTRKEDGTVVIGPGTTFSQLARDPVIRKYVPVLAEAADQVGGPQIRNMGTIGGNICNGAASADSASALLVLNAELELEGSAGTRRVLLTDFYTGPGKTIRRHDEILTAIRLAVRDYTGFGSHYIKYGKRNAMEIAALGCAVGIKPDAARERVSEIRIAYVVAAPTPIRLYRTEEALRGKALFSELTELAKKEALEEIRPRSSWRASREFRMQIAGELLERALAQAVAKAGGEIHA